MQALINTIVSFATAIFDFFKGIWEVAVKWIRVVWNAAMDVADLLLSAFLQLFVWIVQGVTEVLLILFSLAVNLLPSMPDSPSVGSLGDIVTQANRYIPVSEMASMTGVWSAIFAAVGMYKLAKFVRGAG